MLSKSPLDIEKLGDEEKNRGILRLAMIAELDAISLYEQLAAMTDKDEIRRVLFDVAKEEKTHMGEFQLMLLKEDEEQLKELEHGKEEVEKLIM